MSAATTPSERPKSGVSLSRGLSPGGRRRTLAMATFRSSRSAGARAGARFRVRPISSVPLPRSARSLFPSRRRAAGDRVGEGAGVQRLARTGQITRDQRRGACCAIPLCLGERDREPALDLRELLAVEADAPGRR
jgi:hypothetical protein